MGEGWSIEDTLIVGLSVWVEWRLPYVHPISSCSSPHMTSFSSLLRLYIYFSIGWYYLRCCCGGLSTFKGSCVLSAPHLLPFHIFKCVPPFHPFPSCLLPQLAVTFSFAITVSSEPVAASSLSNQSLRAWFPSSLYLPCPIGSKAVYFFLFFILFIFYLRCSILCSRYTWPSLSLPCPYLPHFDTTWSKNSPDGVLSCRPLASSHKVRVFRFSVCVCAYEFLLGIVPFQNVSVPKPVLYIFGRNCDTNRKLNSGWLRLCDVGKCINIPQFIFCLHLAGRTKSHL